MEIIKKIDDLTRERFGFTFLYGTIILDSYFLEKKEDKSKRKYNSIKKYNRLFKRESNISEEEVLLNDDIKKEAINLFTSNITCKKWSEFKS
jgi:hypothetical protein